ncbi:alpha/beta fold hydrolase [Dactylosporangium sp. NPDC051485]|uniref:alpha/beta fold hydrolase n=1 Tax=Dactylosporangium sp. NPDC051485 TaxID=3154846 RepID=UPI00341DB25F
MTALAIPAPVHHRYADVDGVRVFYREAGPADAPALLLLHGFPSSSHQYRRLIDTLAGRYHVIAPDYPGFGFTEAPDGYVYTFDALADTIDGFVETLGLRRFALQMFDFGGPVGLRLALRHPERITGIVVQNANAYADGLSELARDTIANRPGVPGAEERVREILTLPVTRGQYEGGTADPTLVDPSGWTLDQHFLDSPGRERAQIALALDYHCNVAAYPQWQRWLREHRPPALILWGRNDPFFTEAGAHAYRTDLPDAAVHVFDTGHFALEEHLPRAVALIDGFLRALPRKIAVIGAGGRLGGAIAREAADRGHQVTPLGRSTMDVTDPASVSAAVAGHDAVVAAIKGPDGVVPRGAAALLAGLTRAGVHRLVFVGGGGSLEYAPGRRFVDSPDFPAAYRQTAQDQAAALDLLRSSSGPVSWTYASPPPVHLVDGARTGHYRTEARDTPLTDAAGESRISIPDYAAAIVDTIEQGGYDRQRVTVAYA